VAYESINFQRDNPELVGHMVNHNKPRNRKRKSEWEEETMEPAKELPVSKRASVAIASEKRGIDRRVAPKKTDSGEQGAQSIPIAETRGRDILASGLGLTGQLPLSTGTTGSSNLVPGGHARRHVWPNVNPMSAPNPASLQADHFLRSNLAANFGMIGATTSLEQQLLVLQSRRQQQLEPASMNTQLQLLSAQGRTLPNLSSSSNSLELALLEQQQLLEAMQARHRINTLRSRNPPADSDERNTRPF
jgi:hypothetical protein